MHTSADKEVPKESRIHNCNEVTRSWWDIPAQMQEPDVQQPF